MEFFWEGFEKRAVSLAWINKRLSSGIEKRMANVPKMSLEGAVSSGKSYIDAAKKQFSKPRQDLGEQVTDAAKAMSPRTHFRDFSDRGRQDLREAVHAAGKILPKK